MLTVDSYDDRIQSYDNDDNGGNIIPTLWRIEIVLKSDVKNEENKNKYKINWKYKLDRIESMKLLDILKQTYHYTENRWSALWYSFRNDFWQMKTLACDCVLTINALKRDWLGPLLYPKCIHNSCMACRWDLYNWLHTKRLNAIILSRFECLWWMDYGVHI